MLSDIIAPDRLRVGNPQALAALVAVGGWPVVTYCDRVGAGVDVANAVVLAFVTFRRRVIEAGDESAADFERILLESVRGAVDELSGGADAGDAAHAADEAFARATPRPLSPRLATQILHALVEAAPVRGDPAEVRAVAERSYADAYGAAQTVPPVAGEEGLVPASPLLLRAAAGRAPVSPGAPDPAPARAPGRRAVRAPRPPPAPTGTPRLAAGPLLARLRALPSAGRAGARAGPVLARLRARSPAGGAGPFAGPLLARLRALPPAGRAGAFAGALVLVVLMVALLSEDDSPVPVGGTATAPPQTATGTGTLPVAATATQGQVLPGALRKPLTASGMRFEVALIANASWARKIRADDPRRGSRWVTIAVRSRNLSRRNLLLRTLGYRLRTGGGVIIGPRRLDIADGPTQGREGRLLIGSRASVHLGFEVPVKVVRPSFAFEPGGLEGPTVLVSLGERR